MTPDLQKSSKNLEILIKFLFLETTKKVFIHNQNNILDSFWRILGSYNENEDLVIFEKFHDPGPAKKFKKFGNILKKIFFSKQPKKSQFTFGTTFRVVLVNFRLI